jgi:type IV pilus assembly protein PilA
MKQRMTKRKKRGFSLMELLVVIGITGILMAMAAPKYEGMIRKAQEMEQKSYIREALNYVDLHNLENSSGRIALTATLASTKDVITHEEYSKILGKINYKNTTIGNLELFVNGEGGALTPDGESP